MSRIMNVSDLRLYIYTCTFYMINATFIIPAPKFAKEQVNLQKKQSVLRQKSLLNEELLTEYRKNVSDKDPHQASSLAKHKTIPGTDIPVLTHPIQRSRVLQEIKDKPSTSAIEESPKTKPAESSKTSMATPSTTSAVGDSQSKPMDRPKSDSNLKDNEKSQPQAQKEPLTLSKMGRSKSKACSLM